MDNPNVVFIMAWISGAFFGVFAALIAMRLAQWRTRSKFRALFDAPPQHTSCRCVPITDPVALHPDSVSWAHQPATGKRIGWDELPQADQLEFADALESLDEQEVGGWDDDEAEEKGDDTWRSRD